MTTRGSEKTRKEKNDEKGAPAAPSLHTVSSLSLSAQVKGDAADLLDDLFVVGAGDAAEEGLFGAGEGSFADKDEDDSDASDASGEYDSTDASDDSSDDDDADSVDEAAGDSSYDSDTSDHQSSGEEGDELEKRSHRDGPGQHSE